MIFSLILLGLIILVITIPSNQINDESDVYERPVDYNKKEELFHHPTTGYSGTKSEMDAYIVNRENKLKNGV